MANENQTAKERPEYLLEVKGLKKYFDITHGFSIGKGKQYLRAVDGVSFAPSVRAKTLGLVGESGLRQIHYRQLHHPPFGPK